LLNESVADATLVTEPGTLAPSATVPANATYYITNQDWRQGYVTNSAIGTGTAIGSLIQVASNPAFNQTIIPRAVPD